MLATVIMMKEALNGFDPAGMSAPEAARVRGALVKDLMEAVRAVDAENGLIFADIAIAEGELKELEALNAAFPPPEFNPDYAQHYVELPRSDILAVYEAREEHHRYVQRGWGMIQRLHALANATDELPKFVRLYAVLHSEGAFGNDKCEWATYVEDNPEDWKLKVHRAIGRHIDRARGDWDRAQHRRLVEVREEGEKALAIYAHVTRQQKIIDLENSIDEMKSALQEAEEQLAAILR